MFDQDEWKKKIGEPHWYFEVPEMIKRLRALHDSDRALYELEKEKIYDFFEKELTAGNIALGSVVELFCTEIKINFKLFISFQIIIEKELVLCYGMKQ